jgi:hypothetical protein
MPLEEHRDENGAGGEDAFFDALGIGGAQRLHAEVRTGQRGGFDTRVGTPRPFDPVVVAGSVLLLGVPALDDDFVAHLTRLETHGIGAARDRGFGAVRFSDPIHLCGGPS